MLSARSIQRQDALARLSPERHFLVPAHAEFRRCVRAYVRAPAPERRLASKDREGERHDGLCQRERDDDLFKTDRDARRKREEEGAEP